MRRTSEGERGDGPWGTRVAAFSITRRADGAWLVLRHRRLGVVRWEVPGGHADETETVEAAAARETEEETGVAIDVGPLAAICSHEWAERRQRRLILFFTARPRAGSRIRVPPHEPDILSVEWVDPVVLPRPETSPFLHPLLDAGPRLGDPRHATLRYRARHQPLPDGTVGPVVVDDGH